MKETIDDIARSNLIEGRLINRRCHRIQSEIRRDLGWGSGIGICEERVDDLHLFVGEGEERRREGEKERFHQTDNRVENAKQETEPWVSMLATTEES